MADELVVRGFDIGNLKGQPLRRVVLQSDPFELEVILGREENRVLVIVHAIKGEAFDNIRALTNTGPDFSGLLISAARPAAEILAASLEHAAVELRKQLALAAC
jgi:hypothetical protein